MARRCQVTGKSATVGNKVSHSNIKSKRRWLPNLKSKRFFDPSTNRWVRLTVSTAGMRTIDKLGIERVLAELRARGESV